MNRLLVIFACLITLSGCAITIPIGGGVHTPPFKASYVAEAAFQGLLAVDAGDTVTIARNPQSYREVGVANTFVGEHPNEGAVKAYFALSGVAHFAVSHWLDNRVDDSDAPFWRWARVVWHVGGISMEGYYVAHNQAMGIAPYSGPGTAFISDTASHPTNLPQRRPH